MAGTWAVCPEDGGRLLENPDWGERLWCPSNGHGGNGKFYRPSEAREEAMTQTRKMRPAMGRPPTDDNVLTKMAKQAAAQPRAITIKPDPAPVAAANAARPPRKAPKPCECECGGMTKGGRFLPGHDSILHARLKREAAAE